MLPAGPDALRFKLSGSLSGRSAESVQHAWQTALSIIGDRSLVEVVASCKCYALSFDMTGNRIGRQLSLATRRELIQAITEMYHAAGRAEKKILDEFIKVTGYHRKHAIRALRRTAGTAIAGLLRGDSWCANDPLGNGGSDCGKQLKEAIPTLVEAMQR